MPVIILGGIYSGMFTATEAAAISVVYALIVEGLVYRELTLRQLADIVEGAAITSCIIFVLIGMGSILAFFLTLFQLPTLIIEVIDQLSAEPLIFLLVVNITFIIDGIILTPPSAPPFLFPL